ncbi:MAG: VWA domain-containing protein [Verrucomicrobiae bacterium]|nr:VWA domain-containing protein [Verrucomicrobiae bacterium]
MTVRFTDPGWLWLLPFALAWVLWLARTSRAGLEPAPARLATVLRALVVVALVTALAGLQWLRPVEGMNVLFLLDRSDSMAPAIQAGARDWMVRAASTKPVGDRAGLIVFGSEAALEVTPTTEFAVDTLTAVVPTTRTDIGAALRLATAAFPETGQRRAVLIGDGHENRGHALDAALAAGAAGVRIDVLPLAGEPRPDAWISRLHTPTQVRRGQTFEILAFIQSDAGGPATVTIHRDGHRLGAQELDLEPGKNLVTFSQTLPGSGFHRYEVALDAPFDEVPGNNRAEGFVQIRGLPRILLLSSDPTVDRPLIETIGSEEVEMVVAGRSDFPESLAELQAFDAVVLGNVFAPDWPRELWVWLEQAVRDLGVGVVCIGGDQSYGAGGYRGTPLQALLPVEVELANRQTLPSGALALVLDQSGSMRGDKLEMAKAAAIAAVNLLGPRDQVAVIAFDGETYTVVDLQPVGARRTPILDAIERLQSGGGTDMYPALRQAFELLSPVHAGLKHCLVLTDGHSQPAEFEALAREMASERITLSTVGLGDEVDSVLLETLAELGGGRFYAVSSPADLPRIYLQETALVLRTAVSEEPFEPQQSLLTEPVRGLDGFPMLLGHVVTEPKARAETPLATPGGDPLLAHWQYGLGRVAAFTSDSRDRWAAAWLAWEHYGTFWRQVVHWALRRIDSADLLAEILLDGGRGRILADALAADGSYRDFLDVDAVVIHPDGRSEPVGLRQTAPGRYEGEFDAHLPGAYLARVQERESGVPRASTLLGASLRPDIERPLAEPNLPLLTRIAEETGGRVLDPAADPRPFLDGRQRTRQPVDLWPLLLQAVIGLFLVDVAVRRVRWEPSLWRDGLGRLRSRLPSRASTAPSAPSQPRLATLLARRDAERQALPRPESVPVQVPIEGAATSSSAAPVASDTPPVTAARGVSEATTQRLLAAKRRARERAP